MMITLCKPNCTVRGNGMPLDGDNKTYCVIVKSSLFGVMNVIANNVPWTEVLNTLKKYDIKSFVYDDVLCGHYVKQKCKVY